MWGFIRGVWCGKSAAFDHLLVGFLAFRSGREIFVHSAAFHDENYAASGGGVMKKVAVHGDDIGIHAGSDGANFIFQA